MTKGEFLIFVTLFIEGYLYIAKCINLGICLDSSDKCVHPRNQHTSQYEEQCHHTIKILYIQTVGFLKKYFLKYNNLQ